MYALMFCCSTSDHLDTSLSPAVCCWVVFFFYYYYVFIELGSSLSLELLRGSVLEQAE